jgi:adenylate kinase family enzyme
MLNGPGGAGKTTTARLLAERLERCAFIEVDDRIFLISFLYVRKLP